MPSVDAVFSFLHVDLAWTTRIGVDTFGAKAFARAEAVIVDEPKPVSVRPSCCSSCASMLPLILLQMGEGGLSLLGALDAACLCATCGGVMAAVDWPLGLGASPGRVAGLHVVH